MSEVSTKTITYHDNVIYQTLEPDPDGRTHYSFLSPYEITINDCLVKGVIKRATGYILHIDISGTEAQRTLSDFITDIATTVGLVKEINIHNIALDLCMDSIVLNLADNPNPSPIINMIHQNPQLLRGCQADVVIEWSSFFTKNGDMGVNLTLTHLTVSNITCPSQNQNPRLPNVLDIIRNTSAKTIDPLHAPILYGRIDDIIEIRYQVIN